MRAHRTDLVSLAFGLLFVGLATWWLVARLLGFVLPPVGWFLAGALLLIGVLGLVGALRAARSAGPVAPQAPAAVPDPATGFPPAGTPHSPAVPDPATGFPPAGAFDPAAAPGFGDPMAGAGYGQFDRTGDVAGRPERREWDVPAPVSGASGTVGPGRDDADEWPAEAVTDRRDEAVQDRPADAPGGLPPAPPAGDAPR